MIFRKMDTVKAVTDMCEGLHLMGHISNESL
jgi:hypothetical protein